MDSSILVRDYISLTMNDRDNAIEQARQFGAEAMDSDLAGDGVEIGQYQSEECTDAELSFWREEVTPEVSSVRDINDPRLASFVNGWRSREYNLREDGIQ